MTIRRENIFSFLFYYNVKPFYVLVRAILS